MNVVQTVGTRTVVLSSATFPYTVVSVNITTSGGPVLVTVYGDAENVTASSWGRLALYRGATKLGTEVQFEANGASENCPYSCIVVDNPAAGTYTYSMKITTLAGSNFNFGELEGPVITATELTGAVGPQGPAGSGGGGTVTSVSALTLGTTGTDVSSSVANSTSTPVITLNIPTASVTNRGALSSTDWSTFNNKQDALVSGTNIKTINGTSLLGSTDITVTGGLVPTAIKTANGYTASANDLVRCNTTSGGFSVTLPASPTDGATIGFLDMAGTFATSNLTVLPNTGKTIESDSTSYILDINGTSVSFVYNLASTNWRLLQTPSVPATAVLSTGKAIAMSIVFGG
jgi:hypothetical protein